MTKKKSYSAKDIEILEGLQPVRKRPGMYIGNTNEEGLHHLVNEILDNSIDEVVAGHAKNISFHYAKDKSITIKDDGRGIPIDFHPKFKNKRALEIGMTTLHSGGKFSNNAYKTSGGLHGVGISVVNALSKELEVKVFIKSKLYFQKYSRGKPKDKIKIKKCPKNNKGTEIRFIPDEKIFENINFSSKKLFNFIRMKAVLVKGTKIFFKIDKELIKDNTPTVDEFYYPNGIVDYVKKNFDISNNLISKFFWSFGIAILFLVWPSKLGELINIEIKASEKSNISPIFILLILDIWFFVPNNFNDFKREFLREFSWDPPSGVSIVLQKEF